MAKQTAKMPANQSNGLNPLTPAEKYKLFLFWSESRGVYFRFNLDSKLTGFHDMYEQYTPSKHPGPKSIVYPSWFSFLVPANSITAAEIQGKFLDPTSGSALNLPNLAREVSEFAEALIIYRSGRSSEVTDFILGMETVKARVHRRLGGGKYELGIAYSPDEMKGTDFRNKTYAYVPELSWFTPELQALKFDDIIKIFPPYEAEMFKLIIGRACVGRTGSVHPGTNKIIEHGFRKAGIVVGEPSVGKSKTLTGIIEAMQYVGYNVSSIGEFGSKFNQGPVIVSHLAYKDDLNLKNLEDMLTAHSFKSIVTGGTEKVENKGVDAVEVVANTVILANCNEIKPELSYELDAGAINRLGLISTYKVFEMEEMSEIEGHDLHPIPHIRWLCEQYNTDPLSLYLRVLRDCTDFFMDKVNSGVDVHFYSESLMPYLRIATHKNALECFIRLAMLCYAIRDQKCNGANYIPEINLGTMNKILENTRFIMIDMRANNLRRIMKADWESQSRQLNHPYWAQRKLLLSSIDQSYEAFNTYKNDKDLGLAIESVFSVLRLRDGFSMSKKMQHIVRAWEGIRGESNRIYALAKKLTAQLPQEELDVITNLAVRTDANYLYKPDYDPKKL
jgi:hypothetical protein